MKRNTILTLIICFIATTGLALAQPGAKDTPPPPSSEVFTDTDEIAVPWWEGFCKFDPPSSLCNPTRFHESQRLTIYNDDGSVWYSFSIYFKDADHFDKQKNPAFRPFGRVGVDTGISVGPILRLTGVSKDWYKVEVNEDTRETRYISSHEIGWQRASWEYWLKGGIMFFVRPMTPVYDKPGGEVIEAAPSPVFFFYGERSGDWIKARGKSGGKEISGWIKWRDGRKILIDCNLNQYNGRFTKQD